MGRGLDLEPGGLWGTITGGPVSKAAGEGAGFSRGRCVGGYHGVQWQRLERLDWGLGC